MRVARAIYAQPCTAVGVAVEIEIAVADVRAALNELARDGIVRRVPHTNHFELVAAGDFEG